MNKILITSLISASLLFTGCKVKSSHSIYDAAEYEDYTYELIKKDDRVDEDNYSYTYFEYYFRNTGEEYIRSILVRPFYTTHLIPKEGGDVFKDFYSLIPPEQSETYFFKIYGYTDEDITFSVYSYKECVSDVTYALRNVEYCGTPGNSDGVYSYVYLFEADISYDKEEDFYYFEYASIRYKNKLYSYPYTYDGLRVKSKEELDYEEISIEVLVFKQDRIEMDTCYIPVFNEDTIKMMTAILMISGGIAFVGGLSPVVVYAILKIKNRKRKQS